MKRAKPLRIDHNRGADIPLIELIGRETNAPHIREIGQGLYWVDLPPDVCVSVEINPKPTGGLPDFTVTTWRNAHDRATGAA